LNYKSFDISIDSFEKMSLSENLLSILNQMKINIPTTIQQQAIPFGLDKDDAVIVSETGSGKTLSYLLPVVSKTLKNPTHRSLILVPSREVADQVFKVLLKLTENSILKSALVISGTPNKQQVSQLNKRPHVIVATPGRLNDHLSNNKLLLQGVEMVVIDEAERMLDLGFSEQLKRIKKTMRGAWQTVMFSASFNSSVESIASQFMQSQPYLIKSNAAERPTAALRQKLFFIDEGMKNDCLSEELKKIKGPVIVFAGNQISCEKLGEHLQENNYSCDLIHGGLNPGHRQRVLREFREQKIQIMITTDLLARGLDVPGIECVVNYDLPFQSEDFLHRIGRTARAGAKGKALTFVTPKDHEMFSKIKIYTDGAEEVSGKKL